MYCESRDYPSVLAVKYNIAGNVVQT